LQDNERAETREETSGVKEESVAVNDVVEID